MGRTNSS